MEAVGELVETAIEIEVAVEVVDVSLPLPQSPHLKAVVEATFKVC